MEMEENKEELELEEKGEEEEEDEEEEESVRAEQWNGTSHEREADGGDEAPPLRPPPPLR